ncbi:DUF2235 domain-containing protein [Algoriphagus taiwanensis]|uniref:DUF2235 domain-containing protein n=1 Tax=Algoriphagus taiwanensis TaxID=1445656 RepID=A0ABQ6PX66_9BACT|nr:DUF2235 domain-containing protein [Algoriphagus taiwanensis]
MGRNIVLCLDGTDNKITVNENSNVVHLFRCLQKNSNQIVYYTPGIGTLVPDWKKDNKQKLHKLKDQIFGLSLEKNVHSAYQFLMDNYLPGDQIYLFGFSRGAYTARVICGFIEMYGLAEKGNLDKAKYLYQLYTSKNFDFKLSSNVKKSITRTIEPIRFVGIWDTVSSIGNPLKPDFGYPFTKNLKNVKTVRHAVSIDEKRKLFLPYLVEQNHSDLLEVYFAGVHSDIGGSYEKEGLSKIALEWMLGEALENGILLNFDHIKHYVYGRGSNYQKPDKSLKIHDSMDLKFRLLQFLPRTEIVFGKNECGEKTFEKTTHWKINPMIRNIPDSSYLHESVFWKIKECKTNYNPINLKLNHLDLYKLAYTNKRITEYNK